MKSKLKVVLKAAVDFAVSPAARRYEVALALGLYEAIRASIGHA